jgi:hypothetical protein
LRVNDKSNHGAGRVPCIACGPPPFTLLLGVNNSGDAVGYYFIPARGLTINFIYNINTKAFTQVFRPSPNEPFQLTGINDAGLVCGWYYDVNSSRGFVGRPVKSSSFATLKILATVKIRNSMLFGINNHNIAVGSYPNSSGESIGLVYDYNHNAWVHLSDPKASAKQAFGISGTTINGINDDGWLVGFYSDGTKVHGMLAIPTD